MKYLDPKQALEWWFLIRHKAIPLEEEPLVEENESFSPLSFMEGVVKGICADHHLWRS